MELQFQIEQKLHKHQYLQMEMPLELKSLLTFKEKGEFSPIDLSLETCFFDSRPLTVEYDLASETHFI